MNRTPDTAWRCIQACIIVALACTPLFFNPMGNRGFDAGKVVFFHALCVLSVCFLGLAVYQNRLHFSIKPLLSSFTRVHIAALSVFGVYLLTALAGIDPGRSLYGGFLRGQGLLHLACCIFLFFLTAHALQTTDAQRKASAAVVIGCVLAAVLALLQLAGLDPGYLSTERFKGGIWGPLGNPIALGAALLFALPLAIDRVVHSFASRPQRLLASVIVAVLVAALFFSKGRGPLIGFGVIVLSLLALRLPQLTTKLLWPRMAGGLFLVAVLSTGTVLFIPSVQTLHPALQKAAAVFSAETAVVRQLLWNSTVDMLATNPSRLALGFGPETLDQSLAKFLPMEFAKLENALAVPDRTHNHFFDLLYGQGFVGVIAYVALLAVLFSFILRRIGFIASTKEQWVFYLCFVGCGCAAGVLFGSLLGWGFAPLGFGVGLTVGALFYLFGVGCCAGSRKDRFSHPHFGVLTAIFAALLGHLAEIQFSFPWSTTNVYFWAFAGLAVAAGQSSEHSPQKNDDDLLLPLRHNQSLFPVFHAAAVAVSLGYSYYSFITNTVYWFAAYAALVGLALGLASMLYGPPKLQRAAPHSRLQDWVGAVACIVLPLLLYGAVILVYWPQEFVEQQNLRLTLFFVILGLCVAYPLLLPQAEKLSPGRPRWLHAGVPFFAVCIGVGVNWALTQQSLVADNYMAAGKAMQEHRQWKRASGYYSEAFAIDQHPIRKLQLAGLHEVLAKRSTQAKAGHYSRATEAAAEAVRLTPRSFLYRHYLAKYALQYALHTPAGPQRQERLQAAQKAIVSALALRPESVETLWLKGLWMCYSGKRDEGLLLMEEIIQSTDNRLQKHFQLAKLFEESGSLQKALHHAGQSLRFSDNSGQRMEIEAYMTILEAKIAMNPEAE